MGIMPNAYEIEWDKNPNNKNLDLKLAIGNANCIAAPKVNIPLNLQGLNDSDHQCFLSKVTLDKRRLEIKEALFKGAVEVEREIIKSEPNANEQYKKYGRAKLNFLPRLALPEKKTFKVPE